VKWNLEGDRKTAYFHRVTKIKNTTKLITSIKDGENTITNPIIISNHVVNFYKSLCCTNIVLQDQLLVEEVISSLATNNTNQMLTMIQSSNEICRAVFSLNKDSSPGLDGFGAVFFQSLWGIIKLDVEKVVL